MNIKRLFLTIVAIVMAAAGVQAEGGALRIDGAQAGTPIGVYDLSGRLIAKMTAIGNATRVAVPAGEKMVVVKVGERSVKVRR